MARKSQPWNIHSEDFFKNTETARQLFAQLVGAEAEGVAIVPSASYGISVAAANLPLERDQQIVLLADQFPSNVYAWHEVARRSGARIETVARPEDGDWTRALLERINERTRIVAIPNCHWTDGGLVDLLQVSKRTHEVGAALVLDVTQSAGAYPLNVNEIQPDFLVAAAYKWLLGPYSLGFLYVAPQHREGTPLEFSWMSRKGSENFTQLVDYLPTYQSGARRFDMGEHSNFIHLPMAIVALQQLLEWSVSEIDITLRSLTNRIEQAAARSGFQTVEASRRVGHMLGLRHASGLPANLSAELTKRNVFVSIRGNSIRVSPHLYNTTEDIDRLLQVLDNLI